MDNTENNKSPGVTVSDMKEYMNIDDEEDTVIQELIDTAEEDVRDNIDSSIDLDFYRQYKKFNQAVRILVDFSYFNRGNLSEVKLAYPPSYAYFINGIRWKVRREVHENSSSSTS